MGFLVSSKIDKINETSAESLLSRNQSNYELSRLICTLPNQKVISNLDGIFKELNVDIMVNYVSIYTLMKNKHCV